MSVAEFASTTFTETLPLPLPDGVPLTNPVVVLRLKPDGSEPVSILKVSGEVAPVRTAAKLVAMIVEMFGSR